MREREMRKNIKNIYKRERENEWAQINALYLCCVGDHGNASASCVCASNSV